MEPVKSFMQRFSVSDNLQQRILSAVIGAPIVLFVVWCGGVLFDAAVIFVAVLSAFEWDDIIHQNQTGSVRSRINPWQLSGIAYIVIFSVSLMYLRTQENGLSALLFLLLVVWATDIAAYFAGKTLGGPKLMPVISPKKTWAGLCGGMVGASFVALLFASILVEDRLLAWMAFGAILAVIAQMGDLFESWLKRTFDVKDSGTLLPGHGGILDRIDGLMAVAPLLALYAIFNGGQLF